MKPPFRGYDRCVLTTPHDLPQLGDVDSNNVDEPTYGTLAQAIENLRNAVDADLRIDTLIVRFTNGTTLVVGDQDHEREPARA